MRFWSGSRSVERVAPAVGALGLLLVVVYAQACTKGSRAAASRDSAAAARPSESTAPSASPTAINTRHTILFAGTSLTAGLGLDPDSAYPMLIQQKIDSAGLPFTVINAGVSGETSSGLLDRLDWLLRGRFDVLVLETGANDGLRGISPSTVKQNLDTALDRIKAKRPDARVLLVQMEALPNLGPRYAAAFHAVYPAVAKEKRVTLLPFLLAGVAGHRELNQGDGVHPNYRGERIVADNMWRALEPVLSSLVRGR
ncbi:MAG TPA: arylesterase [Gemmatimonadaceae bacterium]|nr:arylesterase [Gemmatimonadaceae bacterium]